MVMDPTPQQHGSRKLNHGQAISLGFLALTKPFGPWPMIYRMNSRTREFHSVYQKAVGALLQSVLKCRLHFGDMISHFQTLYRA